MSGGDRAEPSGQAAVPSTSGSPCRRRAWSVFDAVRSFPSTPESLMSQIDAAIASTEYHRACALLSSPCLTSDALSADSSSSGDDIVLYDTAIAEEAYRAGVAAIDADRPDSAVRSLRVALASCPPDRTSAVTKIHAQLARALAHIKKLPPPSQPPPESRSSKR